MEKKKLRLNNFMNSMSATFQERARTWQAIASLVENGSIFNIAKTSDKDLLNF